MLKNVRPLVLAVLAVLLWSTLVTLPRVWNQGAVFVENAVFFTDADCYSRMTRVRQVLETPWRPVRHHMFENYPVGTSPHATAPLDYLIAAGAVVARPFAKATDPMDLAGAWISPLLAVATALFLWFSTRPLRLLHRVLMLLMLAFSPMLVHGTALGRPDHQSLQILLVTIALVAEWRALVQPRRWEVAGGVAWGMALWVSFYEPLVLWGAVVLMKAVRAPRMLLRRQQWLPLLVILLVALIVEGPRLFAVEFHPLFDVWSRQIGELNRGSLALLLRWTGLLLLVALPLLLVAARRDRVALAAMGLLALTVLLTLWQVRWGYFGALLFCLSLPWVLLPLRTAWLVVPLFLVSLFPMLQEWEDRLYPTPAMVVQMEEQRREAWLLREAALWLRQQPRGGVLAPWWFSPAVAYWSGMPAVAGSSHTSLPGIADSARFYLADDFSRAEQILEQRQVRYVIAYEPDRVLQNSVALLEHVPEGEPVGRTIYERPEQIPMKLEHTNLYFKLFSRTGTDGD